MVIKCPTLKRTVKKLFTLQSMSVHLLLQSSITAMQLIGKKDLKTSLLNKYVLSCFSENYILNMEFSAIKLLGPIQESSRVDLKYHPI